MVAEKTATASRSFSVERLGVVMSPEAGLPHEAWGVLNPAGVRSSDGAMHVFPRIVAEGNVSRIGHALVRYEDDAPVGVERLGIALEPRESYEFGSEGGGVEDPRVVYEPVLELYIMTYTALSAHEPRVAVAISQDLWSWKRLGLLRFAIEPDTPDLNFTGNKDAVFFPEVVAGPQGVPSFGILHRPSRHVRCDYCGPGVSGPPHAEETHEHIWISYAPVDAVLADVSNLTLLRQHERVMAPKAWWEANKVGAGAPPVRLSYGWLLPYHAVSNVDGRPRYCMGAAILDLDRPSRVLYRTPSPILTPETAYERDGVVPNVVFPTATDACVEGSLDIYYGAADRVIAAARVTFPTSLPAGEGEDSR